MALRRFWSQIVMNLLIQRRKKTEISSNSKGPHWGLLLLLYTLHKRAKIQD
jgi:hypothetical protein